jgi:hypothetical protein
VPARTSVGRVPAIAALRRERLSRLEPPEPANHYQRERPGELVHVDVKKLGKISGPGHWVNGDRRTRPRGNRLEFVPVAVDDATRLAS